MPKAKVEKVTPDGAGWERVTVDVGQPDGTTKAAVYRRPDASTLETLLVAGGSDKVDLAQYFPDYSGDPSTETVKEFVTRMFRVALDKKARQDAYEAAQAESTFVTVGKERKNVMDISVPKFIATFNGLRGAIMGRALLVSGGDGEPDAEAIASAEKSVGFGPWKVAARKHVEEKHATMRSDGTLEAVAA